MHAICEYIYLLWKCRYMSMCWSMFSSTDLVYIVDMVELIYICDCWNETHAEELLRSGLLHEAFCLLTLCDLSGPPRYLAVLSSPGSYCGSDFSALCGVHLCWPPKRQSVTIITPFVSTAQRCLLPLSRCSQEVSSSTPVLLASSVTVSANADRHSLSSQCQG